MGPTASGKTDLALSLAKDFPIEIVSVDSVMIYQSMDIGTAKPSQSEQQQVPHHLIDILDPSQPYSAAKFTQDAKTAIKSILARGHLPLLVGGTMLYFNALQKGLSPLPPADSRLRECLLKQAEQVGWQAMHNRLRAVDPQSADRININDTQRIQRALEVWELTHRPMSECWQNAETDILPLKFINIALMPENRSLLHEKIEVRFHKMLQLGFIEEVVRLFKRKDLHVNLPAMRAVGYRQIWEYLLSEGSFEEAVQRGIAATRQLAKRQMTWLRSWQDITYFTNGQQSALDYLKFLIANLAENSITQL